MQQSHSLDGAYRMQDSEVLTDRLCGCIMSPVELQFQARKHCLDTHQPTVRCNLSDRSTKSVRCSHNPRRVLLNKYNIKTYRFANNTVMPIGLSLVYFFNLTFRPSKYLSISGHADMSPWIDRQLSRQLNKILYAAIVHINQISLNNTKYFIKS